MIRIPSLLAVALGLLTLLIVSRSSKPAAGKGRRAVWRSPIVRAGSWWYSEPGWLGWWTTIPDGEIVNELKPPI